MNSTPVLVFIFSSPFEFVKRFGFAQNQSATRPDISSGSLTELGFRGKKKSANKGNVVHSQSLVA
jgi:hypothetical protein